MLMAGPGAAQGPSNVHSFINIDVQKMCKSLGNYVSPDEIIDKYGAEAFRYYFLRHIPSLQRWRLLL